MEISQRLEHTIEKVIYWKNAYTLVRKRFIETEDPAYDETVNEHYCHLLSSAEWLKQVYEEETGRKVTKIGNLPEIII